jgi:hypothetical protein
MNYSQASYKGNNSMNPVKSSKRTLIVSLVLIFLALGIWGSISTGRSKPVQVTEIVPAGTPPPPFKVNIPDKALWKNYLHISVEAPAGTACRLTYIAPMGATQQLDETANESGLCEWRLKISEEEGKGHSRLIFTINGISETHFIDVRPNF